MRLFIVKFLYAFCSPLVWLFMWMNKVRFKPCVYFCGFPIIVRKSKSTFKIGKGCRFISTSIGNLIGVNHRCVMSTLTPDSKLIIGERCGFSGVSIWCFKSITIGNDVRVGANCFILDGDGHQDDLRSGQNAPVVIGDHVWLGANVTVLKGVTIGENSLIGMGSVVTKDIPANVVAAGNPCRVIREIRK